MDKRVEELHQWVKDKLWDANQAAMAIEAVSAMMRDYTDRSNWTLKMADHVDSGMWLCMEMSSRQRDLLSEIETDFPVKAKELGLDSRSKAISARLDSLGESASTVPPEGF